MIRNSSTFAVGSMEVVASILCAADPSLHLIACRQDSSGGANGFAVWESPLDFPQAPRSLRQPLVRARSSSGTVLFIYGVEGSGQHASSFCAVFVLRLIREHPRLLERKEPVGSGRHAACLVVLMASSVPSVEYWGVLDRIHPLPGDTLREVAVASCSIASAPGDGPDTRVS